VTATSNLSLAQTLATAFLPAAAGALAVVGCQTSATAAGHSHKPPAKIPPVRLAAARQAPAGWHHLAMPGGKAVLAFPPSMHRISGDRGTATAARFTASGRYLLYLNATPKQNTETLADWPDFRIDHLTDEDATTARLLAASHHVRFVGGTGTCVIDSYVTKIDANHYTELACFVQGRTSSSVIIAAAPTADWPNESATLMRAVAAYRVR